MKYYCLEGTFVDGHPMGETLQKEIDAHLAYLEIGFKNGSILFSGPKVGTSGGVVVVKCDDIQKFCSDDPLTKAGIHEYRVSEFSLHDCQNHVRHWFE